MLPLRAIAALLPASGAVVGPSFRSRSILAPLARFISDSLSAAATAAAPSASQRARPKFPTPALSPESQPLPYIGPSSQPRCLADLVNEAPVLTQLMSLGVDLSRAESVDGAGSLLLSLDFETDVKPRLALLHEFGFITREAAEVFSGFPKIFSAPLTALRERLAYFAEAGFVKAPAMISRQPTVLSLSIAGVDARLSHLQRLYSLDNSQLVCAATECPKVLTFPAEHISAVRTCLVKGLQFDKDQTRSMVCLYPPLMVAELSRLYRNFALLTGNTGYKLTPALVAKNPLVLAKDPHRVAARLRFLYELGKGQFDPSQPLYVSLTDAVSGSDAAFCSRVADCPTVKYRKFLKTL